jgi:hypothetical protein
MTLAILIPLCSNNQKWKSIDQTDFVEMFLNSWFVTHTVKDTKFYLGYDENDEFFKDNIEDLKKRYPPNFFNIIELPKTCNGNPCKAWNILYEEALKDKENQNEYFYQVGSDIFHTIKGWDQYLINVLCTRNAMGDGVGIAGGVDKPFWLERVRINQNAILENCMVTRKHYEKFGWFFPPEVKNWFSDDLITRIYLNVDKAFVCPNITYINTNRVIPENEENRYKSPSRVSSYIAKNWLRIADKYSEKF